jgi:zinc transporter ZupT
MFTVLVLIATAATFAACATWFVRSYRAATGTTWQRLLVASKDSATILWGYIVGTVGTLITWSSTAADALNLPEVNSFLTTYVAPYPKALGAIVAGIALVTIVARLRSLVSPPV